MPNSKVSESKLRRKGLERIMEMVSDSDLKIFREIFCIAHVLASPACRKNHPEWTKKIFENTYIPLPSKTAISA